VDFFRNRAQGQTDALAVKDTGESMTYGALDFVGVHLPLKVFRGIAVTMDSQHFSLVLVCPLFTLSVARAMYGTRHEMIVPTRNEKPDKSQGQRNFFYREGALRTPWKLGLSVLLFGILIVPLTRGFWTVKVAQSLVCKEQSPHGDALLLENFDPDYLIFERAAALQKAGIASRILVPVPAADDETPNTVSKGVAEVMARVAWLQGIEFIPIHEVEPISLNAAKQIRDFLTAQHLKSVIVVSPGFRSRRSSLVYDAVLAPAGVTVGCVPVFGTSNPKTWTKTWHGIQDFAEQFAKLQYYRFYVLM
jgi:hypothetical protein